MKDKKDIIEILIRKTFAKNLKRLREDKHMSQMDLADITGLSHNFINEIENEKKWPSVETIAKLVKALSVEPYRLFLPEPKLDVSNVEILQEEITGSITTAVREKINFYIKNSIINETDKAE